jgi:hypothetical protein
MIMQLQEEEETLVLIYGEDLLPRDHLGWRRIKIFEKHDKCVLFAYQQSSAYPSEMLPFALEGIVCSPEELERINSHIKQELFLPDQQSLFGIVSWLTSDLPDFLGRDPIPDEVSVTFLIVITMNVVN